MPLTKKFLKSKPVCKVTFKLSKDDFDGAKKVSLVGEFNDWNPLATPMKSNKDGTFSVTLDLATGKAYQFRYLVDGHQWVNESAADSYSFCTYGNCDNSVLML